MNPVVQIDNERISFAFANRRRIVVTETAGSPAGISSSFAATFAPITVSKADRIISNPASTMAS